MGLNNDTLKNIQDTAINASSRRILKADCEPNHIYYTLDKEGNLLKTLADPPSMNAKMFDFESLLVMANANLKKQLPVSIWYSESGVVLVQGADARNRARIELSPSAPFAMIRDWDRRGGIEMVHKAIYGALRTVFADCLPQHPDLRQLIGRVDINKVQQLASELLKNKVSLDRSMMAEAAGADKLPDVLTFTVPAFAQAIAQIKVNIRVAFALDAENEAFTFTVLPGEIQNAIFATEDWLFRKIGTVASWVIGDGNEAADKAKVQEFADKCRIYRGTP